jgi:hypothetical protein
MPSPSRLLITPAERKTFMTSLLEIISNMSYNKQSESAKRGMATVTGDTEQDSILHTVVSVEIATVNGKMPEGPEKDMHSLVSVGITTVDSKTPEGKEKDMHSLACVGVVMVDGKMPEGMLQYLNQNWGGEWYLASTVKSRREGAKAGKMIRNVGAKAGEQCRPNYAWCFGVDTYTSKEVKSMCLHRCRHVH